MRLFVRKEEFLGRCEVWEELDDVGLALMGWEVEVFRD